MLACLLACQSLHLSSIFQAYFIHKITNHGIFFPPSIPLHRNSSLLFLPFFGRITSCMVRLREDQGKKTRENLCFHVSHTHISPRFCVPTHVITRLTELERSSNLGHCSHNWLKIYCSRRLYGRHLVEVKMNPLLPVFHHSSKFFLYLEFSLSVKTCCVGANNGFKLAHIFFPLPSMRW